MKKKFLKCIELALPIFALLISSCGKPGSDKEPTGPDIFDKIDLGEGEDFDVSKDELQYHSNQDYDVDKNYRVCVRVINPVELLHYPQNAAANET